MVAVLDMTGGVDNVSTIRLLIVDDDPLVRSALGLMLGGRDDITVVGEAADGTAAIEAARTMLPDVVLIDVRMPKMNGIDATRQITAHTRSPRVIVLTTFDTDELVLDALGAGADGYLVKDTAPADLVAAIKTVAAGESILSPSVASTVVAHVRASAHRPAEQLAQDRLLTLTDREREVAIAIGRGLTNAEIAAELFMSVATVKAHVTRVLEKLEANNRVQVAICIHDAGLV
jgi:DNA-binding NarL/FixJ family response regulator